MNELTDEEKEIILSLMNTGLALLRSGTKSDKEYVKKGEPLLEKLIIMFLIDNIKNNDSD